MLILDQETLKNFETGNRVWQGIPGIACTKGGRLFCTFYSGMTSETCGNYCVVLVSEDDGATWSEPIAAAYAGEMNRCFDPVLWIDPLGRLWFTWARGHFHGLYGAICADPDGETLQWSEEFFIGNDIMMNKPTVLSSGEWLFPIAIWDYWFTVDTFNQRRQYGDLYLEEYLQNRQPISGANVYKTVDNGKTFTMIGGCRQIDSRSHDEHMIYEKKSGVLVMLTRTKYGLARSYSYDKGVTWTVAENSGIAGPSSRFHVRRLRSGRLLLINHHQFTGRNNLTAFLSEDDGQTWPYKLLLDGRDAVSYPDMAESEDGYLYIVYDRERGGYKSSLEKALQCAREILLTKIREEDIIQGEITSSNSFTKRIISKLGEYRGTRDYYTGIPQIDAREFVDTVMAFDNTEQILKTVFVYYPLHCENQHCVDRKKLDGLIERVLAGENDLVQRRTAVTALVEFLNRVEVSAQKTREEPLVDSLIDYLQTNIAEDIDINSFADAKSVSIYYLCHLFKKKTGLTIYEYRNSCRFSQAKRMLIETNHKISDICSVCGFSDVSYFTKKFKESEKVTPSAYRKLHKTI